jgi:hypothetical protein
MGSLTILKTLVNFNHNMKTNFKLPTTKMCIVVWYRDDVKHEQLIDTPANNDRLVDTMLMKYHVGYSEIRAVKSVEPAEFLGGFGRNV